MKTWVCALSCVVSMSVMAAPKYGEADQWRRDLRAAMDSNGAMFLKPEQRPIQGRKLAELVSRAEKLFGHPMDEPFGSCVKAASLYQGAWGQQMAALHTPSPPTLIGQTTLAHEAGVSYWACRLAVDDLESKPQKK